MVAKIVRLTIDSMVVIVDILMDGLIGQGVGAQGYCSRSCLVYRYCIILIE